MSRSKKFDYQAAIENSLNAHPQGLTLDEILEHSGLEVDRSTLFRHLTHLIEKGRAERIGKARASHYRPVGVAAVQADPAPAYVAPAAVASANDDRQVHAEPESVPTALDQESAAVVKKAVRTVVREWKRFNRVNLQIYLSLLAKPEQLDALAAAVEKELLRLHEGNLDEFALTPAEFSAFIPPNGALVP